MSEPMLDDVFEYAATIGPEPDETLRAMDEYAVRNGFPHVGPAVGGILEFLAETIQASRIFEFGSGFGYSAYWFARGMQNGGEIILTETDRDHVDRARSYFESTEYSDQVTFEHGDAMAIIDRYDGPFDIVLIDHQKSQYAAAQEAIEDKISPGALVIADNIVFEPVDFESLHSFVSGERPAMDEYTAVVAQYLETVRTDPAYSTVVIPVGSGISVSRYRPDLEPA